MANPATTTSPTSKSSGGFTFIELMFVVITIGIITAAIVPRFGPSLQRVQTERAAFELAGVLRYAQAAAIRQRQPVYVLVREAKQGRRQLGLALEPDGPWLPDRYATARPLPEGATLEIQRQGESVDDRQPLAFLPDGTSQSAVLALADPRGGTYRITIDETTGQVAVAAGAAAD